MNEAKIPRTEAVGACPVASCTQGQIIKRTFRIVPPNGSKPYEHETFHCDTCRCTVPPADPDWARKRREALTGRPEA